MSVVTWQTLRIDESEPDIWYRHLTSSPAVTIATVPLYKSWPSDFWTRWSRCVRRSLPVASTVHPQLLFRRRWYLHRLSTYRQCPQLLINYAGFDGTLRRRNSNDNYFHVGTWRKPNWQSSGALWGGTVLDLGSQGTPRIRRSTYFI